MQRKVLKTIIAGFVFLLAGCQSNTMSTMFSPFPTGPSGPNGMTLEQSVQDALNQSGDPLIAQVHVTTNQNTVILSGYVKKIRQSDMAELIAHKVPGVQVVENHIIVRQ